MNRSGVIVVVPCYNEEQRLDQDAFVAFARSGRADLLLVNDGSGDGTARVLADVSARSDGHVEVLTLPKNAGKAEAVRAGLRAAIGHGASLVGYADADLSTPFEEVARLLDTAEQSGAQVVLGSRVALLGSRIERTRSRHYLGRVFATAASLLLELPVYDTQCGAKFFRTTPALRAAVATPFNSAWAFDVELLGRLLAGAPGVSPVPREALLEVPLKRWRDVGGSRLRPLGMARAALDLAVIGRELSERRRSAKQ